MLRLCLLMALTCPVMALSFAPVLPVQAETPSAAAYSLPALPYAYDALEPVIDAQTMRIHHQKHHQAYVDNLNKALTESGRAAPAQLEALLAEVSKWPDAVRNNAGGHWNHAFFWQSLTPPTQASPPSQAFRQRVEKQFGSWEQFQKQFESAGLKRFGSGWAWLIEKADGSLAIVSTPNQDNPLMDLSAEKGLPLLGCDLWEHAYYLKYQNRRAEYLQQFWAIVNWASVEKRQRKA